MPDTATTSIPERSKGADLRSVAYASWVQIPLLVLSQLAQLVEHRSYEPKVMGSNPILRIARRGKI